MERNPVILMLMVARGIKVVLSFMHRPSPRDRSRDYLTGMTWSRLLVVAVNQQKDCTMTDDSVETLEKHKDVIVETSTRSERQTVEHDLSSTRNDEGNTRVRRNHTPSIIKRQ